MGHGHRPELATWNRPGRRGRRDPAPALRRRCCSSDITPLVAALLDLELEAPDGHLHVGLLTGDDAAG
jgi:hypothetical protein